MYDLSRDLVAIAAVVKRSDNQIRQACLKQIIVATIQIVRQLGFHLSDFLFVLAEFVKDESNLDFADLTTRNTVEILLEAAAQEAATPGRELP